LARAREVLAPTTIWDAIGLCENRLGPSVPGHCPEISVELLMARPRVQVAVSLATHNQPNLAPLGHLDLMVWVGCGHGSRHDYAEARNHINRATTVARGSNMVVTTSITHEGEAALRELGRRLVASAVEFADLDSPKAVLDQLDGVTCHRLDLRVLCAVRFPSKVSDWSALALGKTVFLHSDAPKGLWEEWSTKLHRHLPIGYLMARSALAPHTLTESLQALQPIGADRWGYELLLQYGVRDGLLCPVGGRWLVMFWSRKTASKVVTPAIRVIIYAAASFAAMRLDQLVGGAAEGVNVSARLTPRELAVLRLLSFGTPFKEVAKHLGLGEETVRTHVRKAQTKLGARNRTHAVAEAIRQHLLV
jgi:DNA-binding CsgD family transcriptional regulator